MFRTLSFFHNSGGATGGAIFFNNTTVSIDACIFSSNRADIWGGGVAISTERQNANITNCIFQNNIMLDQKYRLSYGGAIFMTLISDRVPCYAGDCSENITGIVPTVSVVNCVFRSNRVGATGGAIDANRVTLHIFNTEFVDNQALQGGAVNCYLNIAYFIGNKFLSNLATPTISGGALQSGGIIYSENNTYTSNSAGSGGAISAIKGTVISRNDHFSMNKAVLGGGAISAIIGNVYLTGCVFYNCTSTYSSGGAVDVTNGSFHSMRSTYTANHAPNSGGALFLASSLASIDGDYYYNNMANSLGGAIFFTNHNFSMYNTILAENRVKQDLLAYTIHLTNVHGTCSNLTFSNNLGSMYLFFTTIKFLGLISFTNNTGSAGGAFTFIKTTVIFDNTAQVSISENSATYGGGIFLSQSKLRVNTPFMSIDGNKATGSGGGIYVYQSQFNIRMSKTYYSRLHLTGNTAENGGAVIAIASSFNIFQGSVFFASNKAIKGGAVFLSESSKIYLQKIANEPYDTTSLSINLTFHNNTALFGGALYVADNTNTGVLCKKSKKDLVPQISTQECFIQTLGLYLVYPIVHFSQSNFMNIFFSSNDGSGFGNDIFGGLLDRCQVNAAAELHPLSIFDDSFSGFDYLKAIAHFQTGINLTHLHPLDIMKTLTKEHFKELITSNPVQICFCNHSTYNCSYQWPRIYAKRGEAFTVRALTVDQVENPVNGTVLAAVHTEKTLRLYYPRNFTYSQFNYMNFFFNFNTGTKAGNDIYGGLLDRCQINQFSEISTNFVSFRYELSGFDYLKTLAQFQIEFDYNQITNPFFPRDIIRAITGDSVKSLISSDPVQLCFCENNTRDCSYQWPRIFVKKGEAFAVRAVTVDQVENPVNGTVLANVISKGTQLKVDQSRKDTTGACTELIYTVFSTEANVTFQLYPDGPCDENGISSKTLEITFLPCNCPNGLQPAPLDNECRCECDSFVSTYASSCQQYNNSITVVRQTTEYWIQYEHDKNVTGFLFKSCPYDYCVDEPINLSISLPLNVDKQCAYNRTGIMCGECEEGLSLVFGNSRCMQCSNNYLALLIAFAFAGLALVSFILILNMTVAIGTTHGLIFYANIVGANSAVFLPSDSALRFFVSWVNLDLGIETCFYDGMDSYAKVLLQLVFPTYIVLLSILTIILSSYWGWFAKLIGGNKNPVATLCTLFLLSYSKLLRTTISSIQFTTLTYPDGSSDILWLYDPNIPYFTPSWIPFFIISILIIALGTVYTILLLFGQWIRKIEGVKLLKCFQSNKYNAFIDAYHGPFVFKHRYWIGVLLLARIIHHILSSVLDESTHLLIVSSVVCALLILKQLVTKVYKNWLISFVETSYLINLLLFSVSTYYVNTTNRDQVAVANASIAIAFITFIGIVLYHTHTYFLKSLNIYLKLLSVVKKCLQVSRKKITRANSLVINEDTGENTTNINSSLHMSLLREPALDIFSPVSDSDYTPPKTSSASADSRKPTSTTVIINQVQVS